MADKKIIQSVDRALEILEFVGDKGVTKLNEICNELDLKAPTAYGILQTLEHKGYVNRVGKTQYSLGIKCLKLGKNFEIESVEYDKVHILLEKLVNKIGETCYFEIKIGDYNYMFDSVESKEPLRIVLSKEKYQKLPYNSAVNKVYRGEFGDNPNYILDINLVYSGLTCMSIPFKHNGQTIGSVLFTGVSTRFNGESLEKAYQSYRKIMIDANLKKHL